MFMGGVGIMADAAFRGRSCPDDFPETFIVKGRLVCEEHYRVGKHTVTRWLEESGKDRLINARRVYVRGYEQREEIYATFLETLAETGSVIAACHASGISSARAYKWRGQYPDFARDWELSLTAHANRIGRGEIGRIISRAYPLRNPKGGTR
jgi:hypothetical protein